MRKPFYKKSHKCWYVKSPSGKEIRLSPDKDIAHHLWETRIHKIERLSNELVPRGGLRIELPIHPLPLIPTVFVPFTGEHKADVPDAPGVYVIVDRDHKCKYVGQAKSLSRRLVTKRHLKVDRKSDYFTWIEVRHSDLLIVEAYFIGVLRPYANFKPLNKRKYRPMRSGAASSTGHSAALYV